MAILKVNVQLAIDSDSDPTDVASSINRGLARAMQGFPEGDVIEADVQSVEEATDEEANEKGWVE